MKCRINFPVLRPPICRTPPTTGKTCHERRIQRSTINARLSTRYNLGECHSYSVLPMTPASLNHSRMSE
jgi:hypothetical protein